MDIENKLDRIFIIAVLFFGFLMIAFIPPYMGADEPEHFSRAVSVSEGKFTSIIVNYQAGNYVPAALYEFEKTWKPMFHDTKVKTSIREINDSKKIKIDKSSVSFSNQRYQTLYFPLAYLPQSIGIILASVFTSSVYWILIWAKLFLLFFYAVVGYFSIKTTPAYKWLFFLILMMPMSVSLGASVSADGVMIPVFMLFLAFVFKYSMDDNSYVDKKSLLCFCLFALVLALIKQSFLLALFILFIPKKKFRIPYVRSLAFILIPAFVSAVVWSVICKGWFVPLNTSNPIVQAEFILAHPFLYMLTILKTVKLCFVMWLYMAIGVLGWNNVFLFPVVYMLYFAALVVAGVFGANAKAKKIVVSNFQKVILAAIVVINFLFIATELYLSWTPPYFTQFISIIQGRYLIPLMLPMFVLLGSIFQSAGQKPRFVDVISISILIVTYVNVFISVFIVYYF